ncbi:MAG: histidine--tRNA ligase [Methanomicrobia archaeon]|nr:histidine--tRNA ligase [Methanomicrobia archaeon]
MRIERARGTRDFLPEEMRKRRIMEERMRAIAERWGYEEIRTPTFERAELFTLKSGQEILKEMYEFADKSGRHLALRPEITASVIRMYLNELKMAPKPTKWYYFGNCFRYEEPQKGRFREFWQFGTEIIGSDSPEAQAELIALAFAMLTALDVQAELHVGHVGLIRELLRAATPLNEEQHAIVMRLIDKGERAAVIELMEDVGVEQSLIDDLLYLIELKGEDTLQEARDRGVIAAKSAALSELQALLELLAVYRVAYTLNLGIARGLDYYTGMVFEIYEVGGKLGAQNQVCGGGSYRLAKLFGGEDIPSTGFAFGFDRLAEIFERAEGDVRQGGVVVVPIGDKNVDRAITSAAIEMASRLREYVPTHIDLMNRSLKAQLKYANARNDLFAVMIGANELQAGVVTLRDLVTGSQEQLSVDACVEHLRARFESRLNDKNST